MSPDDAIAVVDTLLSPYRLTAIQEVVFRQCWQGVTYAKIAASEGYDADYIRVTGSRLWQMLSQATGERVTKKNIQSVLRQQIRQPPQSPAVVDSHPVQTATFPGSPLALGSPFYVERPPVEQQAIGELLKPGGLLRIRAPEQWGKTSLMNRLVNQAKDKGFRIVRLNFYQADGNLLDSLDRFLRWFCANIAQQLSLSIALDDVWDADLGSKISCTSYMQEALLDTSEQPLLLALDNIHTIFEHAATGQEFLPMLRVWHEEAKNLPIWGGLRLLVAYSTEAYIPLQIHQSPFNVGLPIRLPAFTLAHTHQLAQRYCPGLPRQKLTALHELVNGHPYLIHLALYSLSTCELSLDRLLAEAAQPGGIYSEHLRNYLAILEAKPGLARALRRLLAQGTALELEPMAAYRLESMGLVTLSSSQATVSCRLYETYFEHRLNFVPLP